MDEESKFDSSEESEGNRDESCFVCLRWENLITVSNPELKTKLKDCIPEIDWTVPYRMCKACVCKVEQLYLFRELCVQSYSQLHHNFMRCQYCDCMFTTLEGLTSHREAHEKEYDLVILQKEIVPDQNRMTELNDDFACFKCKSVFEDGETLAEHTRSEHEEVEVVYVEVSDNSDMEDGVVVFNEFEEFKEDVTDERESEAMVRLNDTRLTGRHFPCRVSLNSDRQCFVCKYTVVKESRKFSNTSYMCQDCDVALCVEPCFKRFHTLSNF